MALARIQVNILIMVKRLARSHNRQFFQRSTRSHSRVEMT
jgi:hypothetical protein